MCLIARIRALITAVVLASYSPVGLAIGHESPGSGHAGHLAISLFIGRRTRVAASQQFDIANRVCVRADLRGAKLMSRAMCAYKPCAAGLHRADFPGGIIGPTRSVIGPT
jgi:hypothetical protein